MFFAFGFAIELFDSPKSTYEKMVCLSIDLWAL